MIPVGPAHPRMRGVGQTPPPADAKGNPRTVLQVVPLEQFAVHYYDENGTARTNILIKVGDQFYFPPNGIEWAQSLKPAADWVKKAVLTKISAPLNEPLPPKDAVDIIPDAPGGDNEDPSDE